MFPSLKILGFNMDANFFLPVYWPWFEQTDSRWILSDIQNWATSENIITAFEFDEIIKKIRDFWLQRF